MNKVHLSKRANAETRVQELLIEGKLCAAIVIALDCNAYFETKVGLLEKCIEQDIIKLLSCGSDGEKHPTKIKTLNIKLIEKFLKVCLEIYGQKGTPTFTIEPKIYKA